MEQIIYQSETKHIEEPNSQDQYKEKFWIVNKIKNEIKRVIIILKARILSYYYEDPEMEEYIVLNNIDAKITILDQDIPLEYSLLLIKNNKIILEICHNDLSILETWKALLTSYSYNSTFSANYKILADIYSYKPNDSYIAKVQQIETSSIYAAKFLPIAQKNYQNEEDKLKVMNEIKVMRSINHPNIVKLFEVYEENDTMILIMEYITGGDLLTRIKSKRSYTEENSAKIMINMLNILIYLEQKSILHKDIKPPNVLLCSENNDILIKLIDFGYSTKTYWESADDLCGTLGFFAPELFRKQKITNKVDIYCTGLVLYVLITGRTPFQSQDEESTLVLNKAAIINITGSSLWQKVSEECKDFFIRMTAINPSDRPSPTEALKHPWLLRYADKTMNFNTLNEEIYEISLFSTIKFEEMTAKLYKKLSKKSIVSKWSKIVSKAFSIYEETGRNINNPQSYDLVYKRSLLKEDEEEYHHIGTNTSIFQNNHSCKSTIIDSRFKPTAISTVCTYKHSIGLSCPKIPSKVNRMDAVIEELATSQVPYDMQKLPDNIEECDYTYELNEGLPNLEGYINNSILGNGITMEMTYQLKNTKNSREIMVRTTSDTHQSQCCNIAKWHLYPEQSEYLKLQLISML